MVMFSATRTEIHDERVKNLFFDMLAADPHASFDFDDMLRIWFNGDQQVLAAYLAWLNEHGLEIKKHHNGKSHSNLQAPAGEKE